MIKGILFVILLPGMSAFSKESIEKVKAYKEAESFGKMQNQKNMDSLKSFSLMPFLSKHEQPFNSEEARETTLNTVPKKGSKAMQSGQLADSAVSSLVQSENATPMDLTAFCADLEGIAKEEPSTNSEKLPSIIAKLSLFKEIKKELEGSNGADVRRAAIFQGEDYKCSRNVLDQLLYDCCAKMSGLATKVDLAKCNSEEIALSTLREEGKCCYIGKYDKKAIGLFKKSEREIFCCFPSKMARILQEQAREQLHLSWGKAKKPDCRGLTADEIKRLDFTKLDLREALPSQGVDQTVFQNKLQSFQRRIQESNSNSDRD